MIHSLPHPKTLQMITFGFLATVLVSCGSYQQASYYDNDGIYSTGAEQPMVYNTPRTAPRTTQQTQNNNDGVYGDYFGRKAEEIDQIMGDEIFTDVDDYYSGVENDSLDFEDNSTYFDQNNTYAGNGGWGENPSNVVININDGWGYGFNPIWADPFWGGGFGWNNWGWGGLGWNNWGWRGGFGWNNWGWGGLGWNNWGWGGGFGWN
ncbi:MAG: hypothetical protein WBM55_04545, partial [Muriicola sp.]